MTEPSLPNGHTPVPPTTTPSNPSTLPPEALELASQIFDIARTGNHLLLSQYLTAGIPPNLTNSSGDTLLMLSSYHNHPSTVSLLLSRGADPNALNARGQSPLSGAVFKGHTEVVRILVEEGRADIWGGRPNAVQTAGMFGRVEEARIMGLGIEECRRELPEGIVLGMHGSMQG